MRRSSKALGLCTALLALGSTGCPKGMCFLQVCSDGKCECSISSCQEGASYNLETKGCVCDAGRIALDGQCMLPAEANAYCGKGFRFENGGCVAITCGATDVLDVGTGQCVPRQQVATSIGVQVGEGQQLGCAAGSRLVVEGGTAACVPESQTCARDQLWNGQACVKSAQCPTGQVFDAQTAKCVAYAQGEGSANVAVDVRQWAAANYGPDGGPGSSKFCSQFARKPWAFGIAEGQQATLRVAIVLAFPGGKIATGSVQTSPSYTVSSATVPPKGAAAVQEAAQSLFTTLQLGGGQPTAESVTTTVQCVIVNASKPIVVPATAGM
jgi:hypothetical protein